jgi:hypothetical protein
MAWTITELSKKRLDAFSILFTILKRDDIQFFILQLNRQSQLFAKGENSEGEKLFDIGGGYSDLTIQLKSDKGLPTDKATLFDEGDFYESFKIFVSKTQIEITANPFKDGVSLFERWGEEVLGLNEESLDKLRERVLPLIQEEVLRILTS